MSSWKQIAASKAVLSRETGTIHKNHGGKLTVALAYPNTYGVGMSSLAVQILYRLFNARPDVVCERVFWDERAAALQDNRCSRSNRAARSASLTCGRSPSRSRWTTSTSRPCCGRPGSSRRV